MNLLYVKDMIADTFLPLVCVIILGSSYYKLTAAFKIIFLYCLTIFLLFGATNILADKEINNLFLYHLFSPINLIFISLFLKKSFLYNLKNFKIIVLNTFLILACFFNIFFWENLNTLDTNIVILSNFIIILLCFLSFNNIMVEVELYSIIKLSHFLFFVGIFLYAVSSIIIYSYFKYKNYQGQKLSNALWSFQDNVLIIKYLFFIIGSVLCTKTKLNNSH